MGKRWVMTYEGAPGACRVTGARTLEVGQTLEIGREGELALGVSVPSGAVSRNAVAITVNQHGWEVTIGNRNGAVLHPWGQAPELAAPRGTVNWPLVAVRMLPDSAVSQHWVLIEADDLPVTPAGAVAAATLTQTDRVEPPGRLPPAERQALLTVFGAQLSWPPAHPAEPLLLKQAASREGISISGMQDRLKSALARAMRLGQSRVVPLTDPSYLYVLVRAGYLDPPSDFPHRPAAVPGEHR
ncbi:MAG: hypothetical protein QOG76_411 [Pseudonocardiales bacterium]|nr:hypothetical protein [Pseudonocardiales bacterium]